MDATYKVNDYVIFSDLTNLAGKAAVVTKLPVGARGKNYVVKLVETGGQVRVGSWGIRKATPAEAKAAKEAAKAAPPTLYPGNLVTSSSDKLSGIFVVLKRETTTDFYTIAPLGGTPTGHYYRKVPATTLTKVELASQTLKA